MGSQLIEASDTPVWDRTDTLNDLCSAIRIATGAKSCCVAIALQDGMGKAAVYEAICPADGSAGSYLVASAHRVLAGQEEPSAMVNPDGVATILVAEAAGICTLAVAADFPDAAACPGLAPVRALITLYQEECASRLALESEVRNLWDDCAVLRARAEADPLTGLKNSRAFQEQACSLLASGGSHALLLFDIDHFKQVNDLYGHSFGDEYLRRIADTLRRAMPAGTLTGQIGGDEFAALVRLPGSCRYFLDDLITRCSSAVQRAAAVMGRPELGRISAGVSTSPWQARSFTELFDLADAALYVSKGAGRSTATVFDPARHDRFSRRILHERFRLATRQDRIVPYFQPIVDLSNGRCRGFEVLARWIDDDGRILKPAQFEHVFRDHRLADTLTRTLLSSSLDLLAAQAAADGSAGPQPVLSVNLTAFDLINPEFVFDLEAALFDRGLSWSSLVLEVTEKVILGDCNGQIYRTLSELRVRGVRLAFDDFGTGHGGLSHLRDWPVDILKIDRAFVARLAENTADRAIVEAILSIASRCDMQVIAEEVETWGQFAVLQELGCPYAQGYLFDRPMPPMALPLANRRHDLAAEGEVRTSAAFRG